MSEVERWKSQDELKEGPRAVESGTKVSKYHRHVAA